MYLVAILPLSQHRSPAGVTYTPALIKVQPSGLMQTTDCSASSRF